VSSDGTSGWAIEEFGMGSVFIDGELRVSSNGTRLP
jgi:hypothetical protein